MGNKICVNTKYFSKSKVEAEAGHVMRLFADNKNVPDPKRTKNNFGTRSETIKRNLDAALQKMPNAKKNSNVLIDSVLVLPLEQLKKINRENENWQKEIHHSIVDMMQEMEQKMGLTPVGYKLHMDEGKVNQDTGKFELNPHAHMLFANICTQDVTLQKTRKITLKGPDGKAMRDPTKPDKYLYELDENGKPKEEKYTVDLKGKMPLQYLRGRGPDSVWSMQQDIAAKHLKRFGFERGESKELTKAKHLEKDEYVSKKLKERSDELLNLDATIQQKRAENELLSAFRDNLGQWADAIIEKSKVNIERTLTNAKSLYQKIQSVTDPDTELAVFTASETLERKIQDQGISVPDDQKLTKILSKPKFR